MVELQWCSLSLEMCNRRVRHGSGRAYSCESKGKSDAMLTLKNGLWMLTDSCSYRQMRLINNLFLVSRIFLFDFFPLVHYQVHWAFILTNVYTYVYMSIEICINIMKRSRFLWRMKYRNFSIFLLSRFIEIRIFGILYFLDFFSK